MTATLSLTIVAAVLLSSPFFGLSLRSRSGPGIARHTLAPEVVVWVGDLAPGLKGVLSPVWGERAADLDHDRTLNEGLGLSSTASLAFYRLLLFNTSDEERTVSLADGALSIEAPGGGGPAHLRSVAALVRKGDAAPSAALTTVLEGEGTLEDRVVLPAGTMADLVVAFERRVALDEAESVRAADGATFARRRMERQILEALLENPDSAQIRDL